MSPTEFEKHQAFIDDEEDEEEDEDEILQNLDHFFKQGKIPVFYKSLKLYLQRLKSQLHQILCLTTILEQNLTKVWNINVCGAHFNAGSQMAF